MFLDPAVTSFAFALPTRHKLRGLAKMGLLRKPVEPRLPRWVVHEGKGGFWIPAAPWVRVDLATFRRGTLCRRGDEIETTGRDDTQALELLEPHGCEATVLGRHGGRSRLGKARGLTSRLAALRRWAKGRSFDGTLAHGSHELTLTARRLRI